MKIISSLFLASLLAISSFSSQSPEESPELKEAAALTVSVVNLFSERKFDEALPLAKRALEIRTKLLARGDPQISTSLRYLADLYMKVMIDETGRVIEAHDICHGLPYLSEAAVNAARLARFSSTKLSGMPVKVAGIIQYNYVRQ